MIAFLFFAGLFFLPIPITLNTSILALQNRFCFDLKLFFIRVYQGFFSFEKKELKLFHKSGNGKRLNLPKRSPLLESILKSLIPFHHTHILEVGSGFNFLPAFLFLGLISAIFEYFQNKLKQFIRGFQGNSVLITDQITLKFSSHTILIAIPILILMQIVFDKGASLCLKIKKSIS